MKKEPNEGMDFAKEMIDKYDIKTRTDVNGLLSNLMGNILQTLLDREFEEHMGYTKGSRDDKGDNRRNGLSSTRSIRTNQGEVNINMPRGRDGSFEPVIVKKRQRILKEFDEVIISMYAKGNTVRDIKELIEKIYKVEVSEDFIVESTKAVLEEVEQWQKRPLKKIYPFVYLDCLYVNIKESLISTKKAVYVALGIDIEGNKDVLGIWIDNSESSHFWYRVLEDLKERGVEDILFISSDGVAGLREILESVFSKAKHQRCIVHFIRNMTKCVSKKEWKELCNDFKGIYKAVDLDCAKEAYEKMLEKWKHNSLLIRKLKSNIEYVLELFEYPEEIRKVIYTTNPIESLNSGLRKVTNGKGCFINETALIKVLYLRIQDLTKTWGRSSKAHWGIVLNQLIDLFGERVLKYIEI